MMEEEAIMNNIFLHQWVWIEWCNVWCCGCQKWWMWWWAGSFYFFWNHRDFTRHKVLHKDLLNNAMRLRRWSMMIFLKTISILPIRLVERLWLWKFTFVQKCWKITHIRLMILEKMPWMFEKWQLATAMCVNNCEDADSIICHWSSWSASWMTHPAWYSMGAGGRAGKS